MAVLWASLLVVESGRRAAAMGTAKAHLLDGRCQMSGQQAKEGHKFYNIQYKPLKKLENLEI